MHDQAEILSTESVICDFATINRRIS